MAAEDSSYNFLLIAAEKMNEIRSVSDQFMLQFLFFKKIVITC